MCSKLPFDGVAWPLALSDSDRISMALALNISGSFEEAEAWNIISNNFDGQGVSLGLLNQCLGQGSLQPMIIELRNKDPDSYLQTMNQDKANLMNQMLDKWASQPNVDNILTLRNLGFSEIDSDEGISEATGIAINDIRALRIFGQSAIASRNQQSVDWAKRNIYSDKKGLVFKDDWKAALQRLADLYAYRSVQLENAISLHSDAMSLFNHFGMSQLRSYLFFFDLEVQNGGISAPVVKEIDQSLEKMNQPTETQKLYEILRIRLKYVKKEWVKDVKARKSSLIEGFGLVHERHRDFSAEYCADLRETLPALAKTEWASQ